MAATPLKNYKILIADADVRLGKVLKEMLESMGFSDITLTKSGADALNHLQSKHFDFMITEWELESMGGLDLIQQVRRGKVKVNPALPIIMLTGRAEQNDVLAARNAGVNEYVLKPFSAKGVYARLERLIEHPRNFVVSPNFVGPDRRFKGEPPAGMADCRALKLTVHPRPEQPEAQLRESTPHIWSADMALKKKLGTGTSLSSLITPAAIESAQANINAISSESLLWIQENLNQLVELYDTMMAGAAYTLLQVNMSEVALTISSRAGTFGYTGASKVAYMLHKFCMNSLNTDKKNHQIIAEKHIEALKVTLANSLSQNGSDAINNAVVGELQKLVDKLSA